MPFPTPTGAADLEAEDDENGHKGNKKHKEEEKSAAGKLIPTSNDPYLREVDGILALSLRLAGNTFEAQKKKRKNEDEITVVEEGRYLPSFVLAINSSHEKRLFISSLQLVKNPISKEGKGG